MRNNWLAPVYMQKALRSGVDVFIVLPAVALRAADVSRN